MSPPSIEKKVSNRSRQKTPARRTAYYSPFPAPTPSRTLQSSSSVVSIPATSTSTSATVAAPQAVSSAPAASHVPERSPGEFQSPLGHGHGHDHDHDHDHATLARPGSQGSSSRHPRSIPGRSDATPPITIVQASSTGDGAAATSTVAPVNPPAAGCRDDDSTDDSDSRKNTDADLDLDLVGTIHIPARVPVPIDEAALRLQLDAIYERLSARRAAAKRELDETADGRGQVGNGSWGDEVGSTTVHPLEPAPAPVAASSHHHRRHHRSLPSRHLLTTPTLFAPFPILPTKTSWSPHRLGIWLKTSVNRLNCLQPSDSDDDSDNEVVDHIDTHQIASVAPRENSSLPIHHQKDAHVHHPMPEINVAVVGARSVGKSTFIQRALGLRLASTARISARKLSIDGVIHSVRFFELDVEDLLNLDDETELQLPDDGQIEVDQTEQIAWPSHLEGLDFPRIDGALVLYNWEIQRNVDSVVPLMAALVMESLTPVLVRCKADVVSHPRHIDTRALDRARTIFGDWPVYDTSANVPESQKRCITAVVRQVMMDREGPPPSKSHQRQRANSSAPSDHTAVPRSLSKHNRAASEFSGSLLKGPTSRPQTKSKDAPSHGAESRTLHARQAKPSATSETADSPRSRRPASQASSSGRSIASSLGDSPTRTYLSLSNSSLTADGTASRQARKGPDGHPAGLAQSALKRTSEQDLRERRASQGDGAGFTLEELTSRLIAQPVSKSDASFAAIFLCLYRKFASPQELLDAMLAYFEELSDCETQPMIRLSFQLRHLSIMSQWVTSYPGDFAATHVRQRLCRFVARLSSIRVFAVAAKEIAAQLDVEAEDDDNLWGATDRPRSERPSTSESSMSNRSARSASSTVQVVDDFTEDFSKEFKGFGLDDGDGTPHSPPSRGDSINASSNSVPTLLDSTDSAGRQARALEPRQRITVTKIQWRQLMEITEDDIAREMTRIDWIMYSSIRPRDLVRHVSLAPHLKDGCKSLANVNRMINHFNHVAYWVANMVLLRDKPKHRAQAIEKFMGVAKKLRQMNNYNSVGAVVAGINGNSVHRLAQTRELVSPQAQKEFMRLEILMGTQKSHFAYRLAWANTSSSRIPFLPLHRRDLVSAEEGNRTLNPGDGTRINWRKFEIMGEVIVEVQKSQGTPYQGTEANVEVQRLLLDLDIIKDDEDLYDRSVQLETPGYGLNDKKKFSWFQRQ
ncbi:MAG: hypothetical protein M4579_007195 [Chaenotheca gracillima]|nr:MAG: hypothetical protein M4579_007195 [Chaenotheca gracillima]